MGGARIISFDAGPVYGVLCLWTSERVLMVIAALMCAFSVIICSFVETLALVIFFYGFVLGECP